MNTKQFLESIRDNEQEMKEMLNAYYHHTFPDSKDDFSTTVTYANGKYIAAGCAEGEVSEEKMLELAEWYMKTNRLKNEARFLLEQYLLVSAEASKASDEWENDPENEVLEEKFDKTYKNQFELYTRLSSTLKTIAAGKIDDKTIRKIIVVSPEKLHAVLM